MVKKKIWLWIVGKIFYELEVYSEFGSDWLFNVGNGVVWCIGDSFEWLDYWLGDVGDLFVVWVCEEWGDCFGGDGFDILNLLIFGCWWLYG